MAPTASLDERPLRQSEDIRPTFSATFEDILCEPTSGSCQPCSVEEMEESYCRCAPQCADTGQSCHYSTLPTRSPADLSLIVPIRLLVSLNGYRQEVRCSSVNVTDGRYELEPYLTYQSCAQRTSEVFSLARFEVRRCLWCRHATLVPSG
eukprot:scaffold1658_cov115-Isochrysis_galbana.AAC.24